MKNARQLHALLIACLSGTAAHAVDYHAYAPVLKVEPVMETRYQPVTRRVCTSADDTTHRLHAVAATIGKDIRQQTRHWQQQRRCKTVTEQHASEHISAYRVTFRYGAETETIRMSYDPGDRLPVNVSLSPLH